MFFTDIREKLPTSKCSVRCELVLELRVRKFLPRKSECARSRMIEVEFRRKEKFYNNHFNIDILELGIIQLLKITAQDSHHFFFLFENADCCVSFTRLLTSKLIHRGLDFAQGKMKNNDDHIADLKRISLSRAMRV